MSRARWLSQPTGTYDASCRPPVRDAFAAGDAEPAVCDPARERAMVAAFPFGGREVHCDRAGRVLSAVRWRRGADPARGGRLLDPDELWLVRALQRPAPPSPRRERRLRGRPRRLGRLGWRRRAPVRRRWTN